MPLKSLQKLPVLVADLMLNPYGRLWMMTHQGLGKRIKFLYSYNFLYTGRRGFRKAILQRIFTLKGGVRDGSCKLLHDEQSRSCESVAVSISPAVAGGRYGSGASGPNLRPLNWKTKLCIRWEGRDNCHLVATATMLMVLQNFKDKVGGVCRGTVEIQCKLVHHQELSQILLLHLPHLFRTIREFLLQGLLLPVRGSYSGLIPDGMT